MGSELSALIEAAGEAADRLVITPAQAFHAAIARRVFRTLGPVSAPTRLVHDAVAGAAYSAVRAATAATARAGAAAVRVVAGDADARPLSGSRPGRMVLSALNALYGDLLDGQASQLAIPMAVRRSGEDVPCDPGALRRAFPDSTTRVAVFLHGLAQTEESWQPGRRRHEDPEDLTFGAQLRRDAGITPVYVRYNTGNHVSENGRRLSALLESLTAAWPVAVTDLVLIGHSMGGLVARSACHAGTSAGHRWTSLVRHLVGLGTPHTGVPLEKAVHVAAWVLRAMPESRPVADVLDLRSAGIRDLRFGYLVEDDWRSEDGGLLLHDGGGQVPPLPGCEHTFILATVTRDPAHPLGRALGDLLVRSESASGRHRSRGFAVPAHSVLHVGGLTHFHLRDHPLVYERLREALARTLR